DEISIVRSRAFTVEWRAGQSPGNMWPLVHLQKRRENLFSRGIQQERSLAILTRAPYRAHQVPDQAPTHLGRVSNGRLARSQLARPQSADGPFPCAATDRLRSIQLDAIACGAVPVIALHLIGVLRDQRAADRVAGARRRREETQRVAVNPEMA